MEVVGVVLEVGEDHVEVPEEGEVEDVEGADQGGEVVAHHAVKTGHFICNSTLFLDVSVNIHLWRPLIYQRLIVFCELIKFVCCPVD